MRMELLLILKHYKDNKMSNSLSYNFLQYALSSQEREVAKQIADLLYSDKSDFEIKDVRDKIEIEQHSHLSAIITRLVRKGLLQRIRRGRYRFSGMNLVRCLKEMEK